MSRGEEDRYMIGVAEDDRSAITTLAGAPKYLPSADDIAHPRTAEVADLGSGEATWELASGGLAPWQARKLRACIDENVARRISLAYAASVVRISPSYLSKAFKRTFGTSFHQYVIGRRLACARRLLATTDLPIVQVALECGLSDQPHLTRLFRRHFGAPPNAWRRAHGVLVASGSGRALPREPVRRYWAASA